MPEFENLEPFFDDKGKGRPTPVAPHGESAHEFQPRRKEGQLRVQRTRLRPKKVKLSDTERVSTEEMERDFKAALKAEKKREGKRGQSPLRRLLRKIKGWFSSKDDKKGKPDKKGRDGRPNDRNRDRRNDSKGRPDRRGGKGGKRGDRRTGGGGAPQKKGAEGRPGKKRRPRKGDNKQRSDQGANKQAAQGGKKQPQKKGTQRRAPKPKPEGTPPAKTGDQPPKKRRSRRNRNRRPPSDTSGPASHEV